jgi:hypothetical protein
VNKETETLEKEIELMMNAFTFKTDKISVTTLKVNEAFTLCTQNPERAFAEATTKLIFEKDSIVAYMKARNEAPEDPGEEAKGGTVLDALGADLCIKGQKGYYAFRIYTEAVVMSPGRETNTICIEHLLKTAITTEEERIIFILTFILKLNKYIDDLLDKAEAQTNEVLDGPAEGLVS